MVCVDDWTRTNREAVFVERGRRGFQVVLSGESTQLRDELGSLVRYEPCVDFGPWLGALAAVDHDPMASRFEPEGR